MSAWKTFAMLISSLLSLSCSVPPPVGVRPVELFTVDLYLGTWYEIARLGYPFKRGLEDITTQYVLRSDGSIKVINSGFSAAKQRCKQNIGNSLKVSFFSAHSYGGYHVIALDENHRYALVAGPSRDYLWILSRTPTLDTRDRQALLQTARSLNFPVDSLIWVQQDMPPPA